MSPEPETRTALLEPPDSPSAPFLGRTRELRQLHTLLGRSRLVTVAGPGGVGKTRLALEAASTQGLRYAGGAVLAPLAPVSSAELLAPALAAAVGLPLADAVDARQQLLRFLRERDLLLILDNFEHLIEGGTALLQEILLSAPGVSLLVTSREPVRLRRETVLELSGLEVPGSARGERDSAAVQLFLECARRVNPDLREDLPSIAWICRKVGGLPLAIELAAAWVHALSAEEIAARIRRNADFLSGKLADLPGWHAGLRSVFESSWTLLSAEEQRVFRALSLFRGGFSRGAAAWVAGSSPVVLGELVDRSLVRRLPEGRYEVHEVLRQCASERWEDPADRDAVAERHAEYFGTFMQQREDPLRGEGQAEALEEIDREMGNVRAGWEWAVEHGAFELLAHFVYPVHRFLYMRGRGPEGVELFRSAIDQVRLRSGPDARPGSASGLALGRLLNSLGSFLYSLGRHEAARDALVEGVELLRGERNRDLATALNGLANAVWALGYYRDTIGYYRESLEISDEIGNLEAVGVASGNLGNAYKVLGEIEQARHHLSRSLSLFRSIGNRWRIAIALGYVSRLEYELGNHQEARRLADEGRRLAVELRSPNGASACLAVLARISCAEEDYPAAERFFSEALRWAEEGESILDVMEVLTGVAELWARQGRLEWAREALGIVLTHPATETDAREVADRLWRTVAEEGALPEGDGEEIPMERILKRLGSGTDAPT